tara:strand:- start:71 stop:2137 length:2067 start_codon:yes stop_codon:yes gene_type:complete
MTFNIYNFKLYYPDEDSGGGESEPAEESSSPYAGLPSLPSGSASAGSSYARSRKRQSVRPQDVVVNKSGQASWGTDSQTQNTSFDFDTPDGPGPTGNTAIDLEKRAEARGVIKQRLTRDKDYGDKYSADGDKWGKEKRDKVKRKDYGKTIPPKTVVTEFTKEIRTYDIEGVDHGRARPIRQDGETRIIKITGTPGTTFSITIEDSEECDILEKEIKNVEIPSNGKYILKQKFPSIYSSKGVVRTQQYYDIRLTVAADVYVGEYIEQFYTIYQYKDPVVTFSKTYTTTSLPTLTLTGSDVSVTGQVKTTSNSKKTYTLTITDEVSTRLYVKDKGFKNNLVTNTSIEAKVDRCGNTGTSSSYTLEKTTTRSLTVNGETKVTSDIKAGMQLTCNIVHAKSVMALLDKDQNIIQTGSCSDKKINKFKLTDTNDLVVGMGVIFETGETSTIKSIDCSQNITIGTAHEVNCNATLIFMRNHRAKVLSVITNNNSKGKSEIILDCAVNIPHGSVVTLDDDKNILRGNARIFGSGNTAADTANQLKLTAELDVKKFGFRDITYSFDLDKMLSIKPNAYDQSVIVPKDSSGFVIDMIKYDRDSNRTDKTGVAVKTPSHGSISSYSTSNDTFTYTPNKGFVGKDFFTFQMRDSASQMSEIKTICIKVLGVSDPVDSQKLKNPRSGEGSSGSGYTTLLS